MFQENSLKLYRKGSILGILRLALIPACRDLRGAQEDRGKKHFRQTFTAAEQYPAPFAPATNRRLGPPSVALRFGMAHGGGGMIFYCASLSRVQVKKGMCRTYGALPSLSMNPPLRLRMRSPQGGLTCFRA